MKSADVRKKFIEYFQRQGHTAVQSSSLVPHDDATLLFTNAGMNQFKNTFLGFEKRDYTRAVSSQKCVRAGGKHNDLENVGFTARHHTFFEMLGNFSFGDYFKKDAIRFAWELVTKEFQIPKEKLYVTVFEKDDEAAEIWHKQEGVAQERIYRFGEKDNFWRMGDTGPCGPCTEIFVDQGPEVGCRKPTCKMGCDCDRFMEIWNLVFMQYNEEPKGVLTPLPKPSVDTGSGLERVCAVLQGKTNNYDSDLFQPIIAKAEQLSGIKYRADEESTAAMRVLADHARSTAFLIADGVLPSNEGRGYVLRRIIRRGIRYGRKLNTSKSFLPAMAEVVIQTMSAVYPELKQHQTHILSTLKNEEERFLQTLDQGTNILNETLQTLSAKKANTVPGEIVFKLYDTYGFPVDLTRLMANEKGFQVDETDFETHMQKARETAKASWKGAQISADQGHLITLSQKVLATEFIGYKEMKSKSHAIVLSNGKQQCKQLKESDTGFLFVDCTPFYAESGGQVGDVGTLTTATCKANILNCTKINDVFVHHIEVTQGSLNENDRVELFVNERIRKATMSNHSATHLLHSALRKVLGEHVTQAGSLVDAERLRFDFTHNQALNEDEVEQIEKLVNAEVAHATDVNANTMKYQQALQSGAMALFGEKYGDEVRVVKMGDFSTELCGGTHVANTSWIRIFKIVSEAGVSSGVRRIEAITGDLAQQYFFKHAKENALARKATGISTSWTKFLGLESADASSTITVATKWDALLSEQKNLEKQIRQLKAGQINLDELVQQATAFSNGKLITASIEVDDKEVLMQMCDKLRDKIQSGVVVLLGRGENTHPILVAATKNLAGKVHAGNMLKEIAKELAGSGGGRPDFAQGAAKDLTKVDAAFAKAKSLLQ